jgi:exodeoxyribonuclease VIII
VVLAPLTTRENYMSAVLAPELSALPDIKSDAHPLGVIHGMSIEQYHAGPGISKSGLDEIARSPAIYYARHIDPQRPAPVEKSGQMEGSLAHCAILEPEELAKRYAVGPDVSRSTKVWKDFEANHADQVCIKPAEYDAAMRQADSIRRLPEVRDALVRGHAEASAYWIDPVTGQLCRCRPDWVHPCGDNQTILLDVKTYSDASPREFRRQIARKRYHVQDAFYSDGYEHASKCDVLGFVFVAVETEWPYAACAVMLDDVGRDQGRRDYRRDLNTYADCCEKGVWPGYSDRIEIVSLPAWAINEQEQEA